MGKTLLALFRKRGKDSGNHHFCPDIRQRGGRGKLLRSQAGKGVVISEIKKKGVRLLKRKALKYFWLIILVALLLPPYSFAQGEQKAYVTGEIANLRSGPGTEYELLYTLEYGTELIVYDQDLDIEGRTWYYVYVPSLDLEGWIASWLVTLEEVPSNVPSGNTAIINSFSNLRSGPSAAFDVIGTLEEGTPVKVVGSSWTLEDELWFQVETPAGDSGWVFQELLEVSPELTFTSTEAVGRLLRITQLAPFRKGPGLEHEPRANLPPDSGGKVIGVSQDWRKDTWYLLELLDGEKGWVNSIQAEFVSEWPVATVESLDWKMQDGDLLITLRGKGYLTGTPTLLGNPDRIVLDLPYAQFPAQGALYSIKKGDVLRARIRALDGNRVRLFIDLKRPLEFSRMDSVPGQLTIKVKAQAPHLVVEGTELPQEVNYLKNGPLIYIPLSPISSYLFASVKVDPNSSSASLEIGNRTFYFSNGDSRALLEEKEGVSQIRLAQPAVISKGEVYIPMESSLDVLGLYPSWNSQREVINLDPQILKIESLETPGPDGTVQSEVRLQSTAPLIFQQKYDDESNLLYLTIPRAYFLPRTVSSTGMLVDVTRSTTTGAGPLTVTLHLGRAQAYAIDVPQEGFGLKISAQRPGSLTPNPSGRRVVIDPGHGRTTPEGFYDGGAIGPSGTKESTINLDIALRLRTLLEGAGIQVIMTRTAENDPSTPDLPGRVAIAEASHADLCLSIHNNSTTNPEVGGTETYYAYPKALPLAKLVQEELVNALGRKDRGYRIPTWKMTMVQDIKSIPAVLTEVMFISNPEEEKLLLDPNIRQKTAEALFRAIMRYLSTL
ncbi:MAG: N-acetylmuramoyl-L-alanine amidase [Caldiserica bacterium]|jgi:N-acetylmuramoyl-L-alanine amidase|nr:N-acetylmuramoyl-L-alanine amidase [Caldisericota bacterium]MDH7562514.1 N-acetylmuramoyl-L-alanine amidase [Caldisericota bacterium]